MTDLVFKNEGLLDKYIGDAIMAVWGAPLEQPQHARLACRTGLEMMEALARLREQLHEEDPETPFLNIGIGLNTGPMVVGNMGSESRFDYTVMGDFGQPGLPPGRGLQAIRGQQSSSAK